MRGNYYTLKFAREAKERPTEWIIVPDGHQYKLLFVGKGSQS